MNLALYLKKPKHKVEAQNLKQRKNQLIDVFQSMNMEEEVLKLGGDETTNLAEVAAAYKKQGLKILMSNSKLILKSQATK